jgi:hypothetical protein
MELCHICMLKALASASLACLGSVLTRMLHAGSCMHAAAGGGVTDKCGRHSGPLAQHVGNLVLW